MKHIILDERMQNAMYIMTTFSMISFAGCCTVTIPFLVSKTFRANIVTEMAVYASMSDLIVFLVYMLRFYNLDDAYFCKIQAFGEGVFSLSSIFWTTQLMHLVYRVVVKRQNQRRITITWDQHVLCWGLPLLLQVIPLAWVTHGHWPLDVIESDETSVKAMAILQIPCSFEPTVHTDLSLGNIYVLIFHILWIQISLIVMVVELCIVYWTASQLRRGDLRLGSWKFALYPATLICVQGFFFVFIILATARVVSFEVPTKLFFLTYLTGFTNSICFWILDDHARLCLFELLRKWSLCARNRNGNEYMASVAGSSDIAIDGVVRQHTDPDIPTEDLPRVSQLSSVNSSSSKDFESYESSSSGSREFATQFMLSDTTSADTPALTTIETQA